MKASEVLRRYQQGERDFRRITLRGQSFKGANLSGADFSECDIRGTNFKEANLTGAKFTKAKAGLQKRWAIVLLIAALLRIILSSFFLGIGVVVGAAGGAAGVGVVVGAVAVAVAGVEAGAGAFAGVGAVAGAVAVVGAVAFAVVVAFAVAVVVAGVEVVAGVVGPGAVALTLFACYIAYRTMKGDARYAWIRNVAVAFAATGGTSFYNATLTDANFTGAILKNTDLRAKSLTRTGFKDTVKLNFARAGKTLLSQPAVRDLLINPSIGYKKDYFKADLRGANLDGASLKEANLKQADLSEASLRGADLSGANLTEVNAISTDFTHAYLTGACIEAWNIDNTTKLDHVDCQYVFLLEHFNEHGSRERRPSSGDFQPGEFTKLFEEL
jgi:uncharacterized protein YjbI with pentapeptide repeats